jgi:hypothetical protein
MPYHDPKTIVDASHLEERRTIYRRRKGVRDGERGDTEWRRHRDNRRLQATLRPFSSARDFPIRNESFGQWECLLGGDSNRLRSPIFQNRPLPCGGGGRPRTDSSNMLEFAAF